MLIVGRMVHPPLFLIKCLLFAVPSPIDATQIYALPPLRLELLCLCCACSARRFLRKSHQRFSLPFLRLACLCFSVPLHSSSPHSLCFAPPCLAFAVLRNAMPSHGQSNSALPLPILASHRRALLCLRHTLPCIASPLQSISLLCLRKSGPSMPCHCSQAFTS